MDRSLIKYFWNCGDNDIIEFALLKARLNKKEKEVLTCVLDDCLTQEQTAEHLDISIRNTQKLWYSATSKLLGINWVCAYAEHLKSAKNE